MLSEKFDLDCKVSVYVVSILVVMEYALGGHTTKKCGSTRFNVSILVVMEYALGVLISGGSGQRSAGLNPCCNGICSRRSVRNDYREGKKSVSILVVMEYALGE